MANPRQSTAAPASLSGNTSNFLEIEKYLMGGQGERYVELQEDEMPEGEETPSCEPLAQWEKNSQKWRPFLRNHHP